MSEIYYDVLVVGAGNAAMCAAQAAADEGVSVGVLEKAPKAERGGNSALTGHMRFPYESVEELEPLIDDPKKEDLAASHEKLPSRPQAQLWDEVIRTTGGQADRDLLEVHVAEAYPTIRWLRSKGHSWTPNLAPTAGNTMQMDGRGYRLQERHFKASEEAGIEFHYETWMTELIEDENGVVKGVHARTPGGGGAFHAQ